MANKSNHHPKPSLDRPSGKRPKTSDDKDRGELFSKEFPVPEPTGCYPPKPTLREQREWIRMVTKSFEDNCLGEFLVSCHVFTN